MCVVATPTMHGTRRAMGVARRAMQVVRFSRADGKWVVHKPRLAMLSTNLYVKFLAVRVARCAMRLLKSPIHIARPAMRVARPAMHVVRYAMRRHNKLFKTLF
jgi:hypothetical protein